MNKGEKVKDSGLKAAGFDVPEIFKGTARRNWYEYITPFLGFKWGATVTLIAYTAYYQRYNDGMLLAAAIVTIFLMLEWAQLAYREFKGRR